MSIYMYLADDKRHDLPVLNGLHRQTINNSSLQLLRSYSGILGSHIESAATMPQQMGGERGFVFIQL